MTTCGACLNRYDLRRQSQVCPHEKRLPETQVSRLVRYLRSNPGATAMQLVTELSMPKYTSRISDARQQGYKIECLKEDGLNRYYLINATAQGEPVQLQAFG